DNSWIASDIELNEREETLKVTHENYDNEQNIVLFQNSPNPMRTNTEIKFEVKKAVVCELNVYNVKGEKVANLFNDNVQNDEVVTVSWNGKDNNGRDVVAGFYLYKIKAGRYTSTKKMILMK
ncbi:MAG TPA: T9SS type A sorting domain-containing protein, partial [Candidatus Cloacimonetes bacterium]|nr:T9SS type A sorting domain-containing protein [Candidatus Cloacimonadota bacterium]